MNEPSNKAWLQNTELIGGAGCLDFINSVSNRLSGDAREHLLCYADLLAWLQRSGMLPAAAARPLLTRAKQDPGGAEATLRRALRLRDSAWRVLAAITQGKAPVKTDLDVVNRAVDTAHAHMELFPSNGKFAVRWKEPDLLDSAMWPVTLDLMTLLTSDDLQLVRICSDEECGWVFVDHSRNHLRRWCSMRDCGNRAKVRAHYLRQRTTRG